MRRYCRIHQEEDGVDRPAVAIDREYGPVCVECQKDLGESRAAERYTQRIEAYGAGERE